MKLLIHALSRSSAGCGSPQQACDEEGKGQAEADRDNVGKHVA